MASKRRYPSIAILLQKSHDLEMSFTRGHIHRPGGAPLAAILVHRASGAPLEAILVQKSHDVEVAYGRGAIHRVGGAPFEAILVQKSHDVEFASGRGAIHRVGGAPLEAILVQKSHDVEFASGRRHPSRRWCTPRRDSRAEIAPCRDGRNSACAAKSIALGRAPLPAILMQEAHGIETSFMRGKIHCIGRAPLAAILEAHKEQVPLSRTGKPQCRGWERRRECSSPPTEECVVEWVLVGGGDAMGVKEAHDGQTRAERSPQEGVISSKAFMPKREQVADVVEARAVAAGDVDGTFSREARVCQESNGVPAIERDGEEDGRRLPPDWIDIGQTIIIAKPSTEVALPAAAVQGPQTVVSDTVPPRDGRPPSGADGRKELEGVQVEAVERAQYRALQLANEDVLTEAQPCGARQRRRAREVVRGFDR
ncbi:hypothetical protein BDK51DRAFT_36883 [Blyttiomyces helicus]|uniref:Uncharacterized protein n=1 Tax=Blyttiomyces helicus TaxID=388810 RepID=A0A4P9VZF3_9FUNG|nr:hypothetical protein BDK51DRAFT_36883 [Blyttiomyces helicus]|eukprot:RKO84702.1 hypothetical protein BDK51DRAFT_36883 [Blyttiomyces helicus]